MAKTKKTPQEQRKKDPLAEDFRNFLYITWKHLQLPEPTPVQYDLAYYLQHGPRRKMIQAFRGVGKSWIYAAFVCWRLYRNPDWKIMVVSASKALADSLSTFVKRLIAEMPQLQHLKHREGQRGSNISFDVGPAKASKDPSVKSVGITGQLTGSRADEILADDIESLNNSATQTQRDKLAELVKEFDAVLKPGGIISYLGTPQSEDSIYKRLPDRGYEVRIWPARIPSKVDRYKGLLAPYVMEKMEQGARPGTPLDPDRFDDTDLLEREASYGKSGFALQFMLDTTLSDSERYPLKVADLICQPLDLYMAPVKFAWASGPDRLIEDVPNVAMPGDRFHSPLWVSEDLTEYAGSIIYVDPAGRGQDETGWAVVKYLHGYLFLAEAGGEKGGYSEEVLRKLCLKAKVHQCTNMVIESNFGDGMFSELIKPVAKTIHPLKIEEVRSHTQKELRIIETLEPVMNQHRLIVDPKVILKDHEETQSDIRFSLFYQMTRLTRDRGALAHDDRLEALSGAVKYWQDRMAIDVDQAVRKRSEKALDEELRKFMRAAGRKPRGNQGLWINALLPSG